MKTLEEAVTDALAGNKSVVQCPSHEDSTPSLTVGPGTSQPVVLHCHAGCEPDKIVADGGLDWSQVMAPEDPDATSVPVNMWTPAGQASHIYRYVDARGNLLYEVLRVPLAQGKKTIRQRQPDESAKGGFAWNLDGVERVLYRLPAVLEAVREGHTIHVAEGEKCADALLGAVPAGEQATTNPMGAGKWENHYGEMLSGATVVVYADADDAGRAHARMVRENLLEHGCTVTVKEAPPGVLRSGKSINDVADHLEVGRTLEQLLETTPEAERERSRTGIDILDLIRRPRGRTEFVIPNTLAKGERFILIGFEGTGKALALDTPIATPKGWATMGDLSVGDEVFGPDGSPVKVLAATEVMHGRPCNQVWFSDHSMLVADDEHLWLTDDKPSREAAARFKKRGDITKRLHWPEVRTTAEIRDSLFHSGSLNHSVRNALPLQYPIQELPLNPYLLGAWLGDGTSRCAAITTEDQEILDRLDTPLRHAGGITWRMTDGVRNRYKPSVQRSLRELGLLGNKHIPDLYLHASVPQRIELLRGLMDTDGTVDMRGGCEFSVCNQRLAEGFLELVLGLGVKARMRESAATLHGKEVGRRWRIGFYPNFNVFHLARKAERLMVRPTERSQVRHVVEVHRIESVPVRCIQVEGEMYLAGQECIPTHNSVLCRQIAAMVAGGIHPFNGRHMDPKKVLYIDAENHPDQVDEDWSNLVGLMARHERPIDRGHLVVMEEWESNIDLASAEGGMWLTERIHAYQPDLVVMGPLTNMAGKDLRDDEPVRRIRNAVNSARAVCNSAFIMEHHAPHKGPMDKERQVRPYGSSLFLKWPDYGFGMKPLEMEGVYEWIKNRGPRVRAREWPGWIREGRPGTDEFPWVTCILNENGQVEG